MNGHPRFVTVGDCVPYPWPWDGDLTASNTALLVIDMQRDFCEKGGYLDSQGISLDACRAIIPNIQSLLSTCRSIGMPIIHTREGHRPDLADMPESKRARTRAVCAGGIGIGDEGPLGRLLVRGEPGWDIIPELTPAKGEIVVDKPGKSSFYATDLDMTLQLRGIKNLILTGVTTDVCVHSTMRDANDRGYECVMVTDCTAAAYQDHWSGAISQTKMQGGVFGTTCESGSLISVLKGLPKPTDSDSVVMRGLGVGAVMAVST